MSGPRGVAAAGREPAAARRMRAGDDRIAAALIQLENQLPDIIEEILAGDFDDDERRDLSFVLSTIAADVTPPVAEIAGPIPPPPWGNRQKAGGAP